MSGMGRKADRSLSGEQIELADVPEAAALTRKGSKNWNRRKLPIGE